MPKSKRAGGDFQSKKRKLGDTRKDRNPTDFSSRSVVLLKQNISVGEQGPTVDHLSSQLNHFNKNVRADALKALKKIAQSRGYEHVWNAKVKGTRPLLSRLLEMLVGDDEEQVRSACVELLVCTIGLVPHHAMNPFRKVIFAYISSALTHLLNPVKLAGVSLLHAVLKRFPQYIGIACDEALPHLTVLVHTLKLSTGAQATWNTRHWDGSWRWRALRTLHLLLQVACTRATPRDHASPSTWPHLTWTWRSGPTGPIRLPGWTSHACATRAPPMSRWSMAHKPLLERLLHVLLDCWMDCGSPGGKRDATPSPHTPQGKKKKKKKKKKKRVVVVVDDVGNKKRVAEAMDGEVGDDEDVSVRRMRVAQCMWYVLHAHGHAARVVPQLAPAIMQTFPHHPIRQPISTLSGRGAALARCDVALAGCMAYYLPEWMDGDGVEQSPRASQHIVVDQEEGSASHHVVVDQEEEEEEGHSKDISTAKEERRRERHNARRKDERVRATMWLQRVQLHVQAVLKSQPDEDVIDSVGPVIVALARVPGTDEMVQSLLTCTLKLGGGSASQRRCIYWAKRVLQVGGYPSASTSTPASTMDDARVRWALALPRVIYALGAKHAETHISLLQVMRETLVAHPMEMRPAHKTLQPYFHTTIRRPGAPDKSAFGPFVYVGECVQRAALEVVAVMDPMPTNVLWSIARCLPKLSPDVQWYALEVIQAHAHNERIAPQVYEEFLSKMKHIKEDT